MRAEVLRKGASGGVTRVGDGRRQEARGGPLRLGGGVTGGADRWRDDRYCGRRGKRRSHGRVREQASPEGRAPALPEEDSRDYWQGGHWYYRRGRQLAGPERVSTVLTGGESAAVTGEGRGGVIGGTGEGIAGGGDCRQDRRRRALTPMLSPPVTPSLSLSDNACSRPLSQLLRYPLQSHHVRGRREPEEGCFTKCLVSILQYRGEKVAVQDCSPWLAPG